MIKKRKCSKCGREGHDAGWCSYDEPAPPSPPEQEPRVSNTNTSVGAAIKALDGIAAVNLEEPSEGDLERIHAAYERVCKERDELKAESAGQMKSFGYKESVARIAELERERDALNAMVAMQASASVTLSALDTVSAERDEFAEALKKCETTIDSALAAIGHLRASAKNMVTEYYKGDDIISAVRKLEHALAATSGYEGEEK